MVDFILILGRLRPTSQYHWIGDSSNQQYSDIGEWRDINTTKPTEQECLDEWDIYLVEKAVADAFDIEKTVAETNAITDYSVLPNWVRLWTANDVASYVHESVLNGLDVGGMEVYVDALPNTVAGMKTGLKQIGSALISIRDILEMIAKLLMYIRDLVIKFRR